MKSYCITLIFILFAVSVSAQNCYDTYYERGISSYEKHEYERAKEFFNLADCKDTPESAKEILNNWKKKCDEKIEEQLAEKEKEKERERQLAETQKTISVPTKQADKPTKEKSLTPPKDEKPTYITAEPIEATFNAKRNSKEFHVDGDNEARYDVTNIPDWCKVKTETGIFTVTCDSNTGAYREHELTILAFDKHDKKCDNLTKYVKIKQNEAVATYLRVSPNTHNMAALGETKEVTISTDGYSWQYSTNDSWIRVLKSSNTLRITADRNSGKSHSSTIKVWSGDYEKTITVNQPQEATYVRLGKNKVHFSPKGGNQTIDVYTDGENWNYYNKPYWITARKIGNRLTLESSTNSGQYSSKRSEEMVVKSDNKEATIQVKQSIPFNCPKGDPRPLGLSLGYIQKQWEWKTDERTAKYGAWDKDGTYLNGIQAGVRVEPLFKYGFGLSTGLFYEYYFSKSDKQTGTYIDLPDSYDYNMNFSEHSLYLPLHLEYRANISENFQFFVETGPSIDYGLSAKLTATEIGENTPFYTETNIYRNSEIGFPNERLNVSLDFGAGIRFNGLQLNVGTSRGLMNISSNPDIRIKQNKPLMASLSWMIPYDDTDHDKVNSIDKSKYRTHGIVLEYISKQWEWVQNNYVGKTGLWEDSKSVSGVRIGYMYQPQFIYGFGLRTGLNFDTYISVSDDMQDDYGSYYWLFSEMAANIPLHAEYRLHFSDKFSLFFETGPSIDLGLFAEMESSGDNKQTESDLYGKVDWGYPSERFNAYWDFSGGFRFKNLQFQIGTSRGLTEISLDDGWKVRQNRNLNLGISWMFN